MACKNANTKECFPNCKDTWCIYYQKLKGIKRKEVIMQNLINWEAFTDKELEQIQKSLSAERTERKERVKDKAIQDFLKAFRLVKDTGVDIYCSGKYITENDLDFY